MSRALATYPESERPRIIARRLASGTRGNGYNAALDAAHKLHLPIPSVKGGFKPRKLKRQEVEALGQMAGDIAAAAAL